MRFHYFVGSTLACILAAPIPTTNAQVTLYDNLDNVRSDGNYEDYFTADGSDNKFAQQFLLGDHTNIDQVTIALLRPAPGATGSLRFELWRDNGLGEPVPPNDPTGKIADLGTIVDVSQIPVASFGEYTLDNLILGLEPNTPYWIVTQYSDAKVSGENRNVGFGLVYGGDPIFPDPLGYDATAGTFDAAHLRGNRDRNPNWDDLTNLFGLQHFYKAMKVEAMESTLGQTNSNIVYDNSKTLLRGGDRILPSPGDTFTVQPFNLGESSEIAATHINVSRTGTVSGSVRFSIWDNDGNGYPGQEVGELGTIDVREMEDVGARPEVIPTVTFDSPISGLTPNQTYFVMADFNDLSVSGNQNNPNSVVFAGLRNDTGTGDAEEWLVARPNRQPPFESRDWASLSEFGLGRRWMQMSIEATAAFLPGDLNQNGAIDTIDIDILSSAIRQQSTVANYDLNEDGQITATDRDHWIYDLANTFFGDSNLDGEFNSSDLTLVFSANEYEDNITLNSTWAEGDWNGDGDFDSGDLVSAFKDGGYETGPRVAIAAVPEPSSWILLTLGLIGIARIQRKH